MLAPYPSEAMTCWPVSTRVGNVKNNNPSLIEPIVGVGQAAQREAMNWHRWFTRLLVLLSLAACAQGGQAQAPSAPHSPENVHDRGFGM